MNIMLLLILILSPRAWSVDDSALNQYIKDFQFGPLGKPTNPLRQALFKAGEQLFHNPILSGQQNITCFDCHSAQGFTADGLPLGVGEGAQGSGKLRFQNQGQILKRNVQPLFNMGLAGVDSFFWDNRVTSDFAKHWETPEPQINGVNPPLAQIASTFDSLLAVQAVFPIANHSEMLGKDSKLSNVEAWTMIMERVNQSEVFRKLLQAAYPNVAVFNIAHVGNALAEYQRFEFLANNTPWDLYLRGDKSKFNERMVAGAKIFMVRADCRFCHNGPHLTNWSGHNIGVPQIRQLDRGMGEFKNTPRAPYAFRTPPLRNVGVTAPYMHNGAFKTLRDIINHYEEPHQTVKSFQWNPIDSRYNEALPLMGAAYQNEVSNRITASLHEKLGLSESEKEDLRCFLQVGLTDLSYQKFLKDNIPNCRPVN
jgi:cytochrome c peroxidase